MIATFEMNMRDLNLEFIENLKRMFADKEVRISVQAPTPETILAHRYENLQKRLLPAELNGPAVQFSVDEFERLFVDGHDDAT